MSDVDIDDANEAATALSMLIVSFITDQGPDVHPAIANVALAIALGAGIKTCAKPGRVEQVLKSMTKIMHEVARSRAGETTH